MWVLLQVQELALPRAVVGPVALGRDDPVPSELLKVNCERVPTAARFCRFLVTVEARFSAGSLRAVEDFHFDEWLLGRDEKIWISSRPTLAWISCMGHISSDSPTLPLQALMR